MKKRKGREGNRNGRDGEMLSCQSGTPDLGKQASLLKERPKSVSWHEDTLNKFIRHETRFLYFYISSALWFPNSFIFVPFIRQFLQTYICQIPHYDFCLPVYLSEVFNSWWLISSSPEAFVICSSLLYHFLLLSLKRRLITGMTCNNIIAF